MTMNKNKDDTPADSSDFSGNAVDSYCSVFTFTCSQLIGTFEWVDSKSSTLIHSLM